MSAATGGQAFFADTGGSMPHALCFFEMQPLRNGLSWEDNMASTLHLGALKEEDIWAACDSLVSRGRKPTQAAVREFLGKGSYSTIGPALRSWQEHQLFILRTPRDQAAKAVHDMAQEFCRNLMDRLTVWQKEQEVFEKQCDLGRQVAEELHETSAARAETLERNLQKLEADLARMEQERNQALERCAVLLDQLRQLQQERDSLVQRLEEQDGPLPAEQSAARQEAQARDPMEEAADREQTQEGTDEVPGQGAFEPEPAREDEEEAEQSAESVPCGDDGSAPEGSGTEFAAAEEACADEAAALADGADAGPVLSLPYLNDKDRALRPMALAQLRKWPDGKKLTANKLLKAMDMKSNENNVTLARYWCDHADELRD